MSIEVCVYIYIPLFIIVVINLCNDYSCLQAAVNATQLAAYGTSIEPTVNATEFAAINTTEQAAFCTAVNATYWSAQSASFFSAVNSSVATAIPTAQHATID